ncbi:L-lactate dehydrogenase [Ligilactobacillus sp. WILCCON 0076]|uniref:L-lactate dehydrogenase n=1 Tax=Ligilactobacillus ubinensis TaxID=2876789 RepID=A0A9X2FI66_9LACO|nr:L-lactate dehydrogenase [Ligilactobacillus ubinensis]MCP0886100.1 L-lactate dehydrogenase [Ligilactobacillus ubinensis]
MRKLAVIGLGHVGATVAYTLVTKGLVDELVLIDTNEDKVTAEQYDILDMLARLDTYTTVKVQDYSTLKDADIIITTFGNIKVLSEGGNRFGEFDHNTEQVKSVGAKIKESGFNGVIINVTNPCDVIATLLQRYTGLPKNQVFGTGTFLDTARMQRAVGQALKEDPKNVSGYVLGEHGESQFSAWSTVRVKDHPISEIAKLHNLDLDVLDEQARRGGWLVFHGKHYTSFAITTCAIKLALAVLSDAHLACPASVYIEKFGCYVGYPAVIGSNGVEEVNNISLTDAEKIKLEKSANFIAEKVASVK